MRAGLSKALAVAAITTSAVEEAERHRAVGGRDEEHEAAGQRHHLRRHHDAAAIARVGERARDQRQREGRHELHEADQAELKGRCIFRRSKRTHDAAYSPDALREGNPNIIEPATRESMSPSSWRCSAMSRLVLHPLDRAVADAYCLPPSVSGEFVLT